MRAAYYYMLAKVLKCFYKGESVDAFIKREKLPKEKRGLPETLKKLKREERVNANAFAIIWEGGVPSAAPSFVIGKGPEVDPSVTKALTEATLAIRKGYAASAIEGELVAILLEARDGLGNVITDAQKRHILSIFALREKVRSFSFSSRDGK